MTERRRGRSTQMPDDELPPTGVAPTFRPLLPTVSVAASGCLPEPGERIDDFELLHVLGQGSFAKVFLARQVSLDRRVAVKVSANRGSEARTLASLEHDHIVHVFLEYVDRQRDLRLLCMQYVAGTTLERVMRALAQREPGTWSGRALLEALDALSPHPPTFDPAALRDREALAACDFIEAVCWLGTRLAEALAYAHSQGVLHRDVKPANILLNQYGRPLLADFNIACTTQPREGTAEDTFGGTLAYMAPEHLDAFSRDPAAPSAAVDRRSDVYSLGVVLFELLTGRLPFERPIPAQLDTAALRDLAAERRAGAPSPRRLRPQVPEVLDRTLRRCLDPEPARRFQSAAELARALEGCRELHQIQRDLPAPGPLARAALQRPALWLPVLALLPHMIGSLVNIAYNGVQIMGGLSVDQKAVFDRFVLVYNLIAYPICLLWLWRVVRPGLRAWRQLAAGEPLDEAELARVRRGILAWPRWMLILSCVGWLPGGLLFPLGLHLLAGPVGADVFVHFFISFAISGLIAVTYSYFGVQFMVLRIFYPRFWADPRDLPQRLALELETSRLRPGLFQLLAGVIPLAAAVLMVAGGPEAAGARAFRLLVTVLICLGMAGFGLAVAANSLITRTRAVLLGSHRPRG